MKIASVIIFVLLLLGAIAGNLFQYPIYSGMTFIFGSIFTMLAIQKLGIRAGVAIAVLASINTYFSWHHWQSIVTFTCEAMFVSYLYKRRKSDLVTADIIFWLVIGAPLVFILIAGMLKVSPLVTLSIFLKQTINGITNTLIARLLFIQFQTLTNRAPSQRFAISEVLFTILATFVLIPSLILLTRGNKTELHEQEKDIVIRMENVSTQLSKMLNNWTEEQFKTVNKVARMAALSSPASIQSLLPDVRSFNPNIERIGITDADATLRAYDPPVDEEGNPMIGKNFRDRPYYNTLRKTLRPMLSEVVMGRFAPQHPLVHFLSPVVKNGAFAGYVAGIANLEVLKQRADALAEPWSLHYIIYDKNGVVVVSNLDGFSTMKPYKEETGGYILALSQTVKQWVPSLGKSVPIVEHWKRSYYYTDTPLHPSSNWRLAIRAPYGPLQDRLIAAFNQRLIYASIGVLVSLFFAHLVSRVLSRPLEKLSIISSQISGDLEEIHRINWPNSRIEQIHALTDRLRSMGTALNMNFKELQKEVEQRRLAQKEVSCLNENLMKQKAALEVVNREMEAFSYSVSHDLRAPLRHINSFCTILTDEYRDRLDEAGLSYLRRIANSSIKMGQLIDGLLQLGRVGRLNIKLVTIDLSAMAHEIIEGLRMLEPEREVSVTIAKEISCHGDKTLIRLVLENLIGNAWKYTSLTEGASIEFGTMVRNGENIFYVRDNGIGFDMAYASKLFGEFQRLHSSEEFAGTGVGLATVKRIIDRHGGVINAESEPGKGALFWFTLPG